MRLARKKRGEPVGSGGRVYQDDWGTIARIYDLEHPACRGDELAFWLDEARAHGGTALELAAGSGRVAIALARKGIRVTGLELSEGMLERARARTARLAPAVQERLTWVQGDMSDFSLPGQRAGLVFVAFNSFWLLTSVAAQRACLACAVQHLAPGGALVLDLFPPNQDDLSDERGITQFLPAARRGRALMRVKDYHYNAATAVATSDVRYYGMAPYHSGPAEVLATFRYCLRPESPEGVRALLAEAGYTVTAEYGTYTRDPLGPDTPRAIYVAHRGGTGDRG